MSAKGAASVDLVPIAVIGGLGIVAFYLLKNLGEGIAAPITKEQSTGPGGLVGHMLELGFGTNVSDRIVQEQTKTVPLGSGSSTPAKPPAFTSPPIAYISGAIVDPKNGASVSRPIGGQTVRLVAELNNSGPTDWSGSLRLEVHEDYLLADEDGTFDQIVTVPSRSTKRFPMDYRLAPTFIIRNPNLAVNLFASSKFLDHVDVSVT